MAAALELESGRWGVFDWPEQIKLAPNKREQLLVISSEYLADRWEGVLKQLEEPGSSFDQLVAALADRIDQFIRSGGEETG